MQWMELEGNSNRESSVALLERLRDRRGGRLGVMWDNEPARAFGKLRRGPEIRSRSYLETLVLNLRLVNLPACSPNFSVDEALWGRVRAVGQRQCMPGQQGGGAGQGGRIPGRADRPERRG